MISSWPVYKEERNFGPEEHAVEIIKGAVRAIRNVRTSMNVPPSKKAKVDVYKRQAWNSAWLYFFMVWLAISSWPGFLWTSSR